MASPITRIALIQMHPVPLDAERNFETASILIQEASTKGAVLAVLPEYHLSGWQPEDPRFRTIASQADEYLAKYCELAQRCQINIVPGTILSLSGPASTGLLNKAYFISNSGEVLGEYTKTNLWHPEREHLLSGPDHRGDTTGPHHEAIDTPIGPIGLLICYDLFFPEATRELAKAGAKLIIIPTFTKMDDPSPLARSYNPHGEALFTESALVTRAGENTAAIVYCNVGGPKEEGFMGLSGVSLPIVGKVKGSLTTSEEAVAIVDVDMNVLEVAEQNYKIREDICRKTFHYR